MFILRYLAPITSLILLGGAAAALRTENSTPEGSALMVAALLILGYAQLRDLRQKPELTEPLWTRAAPKDWVLPLLALGLGLGAWLHFQNPAALLFAMVPLAMPLGHWQSSQLAREAKEKGLHLGEWTRFRQMAETRLMIFHQLGVATEDEPEVVDALWHENLYSSRQEMEQIFVALARQSSHPLARSLQRWLESKGAHTEGLIELAEIEEVPTAGLRFKYRGLQRELREAFLGSPTWARIMDHQIPERLKVGEQERLASGHLVLSLSIDRRMAVILAFSAPMREDLPATVAALKKRRCPSVMLSSHQAQLVNAQAAGFNQSVINALPVERAAQVSKWRERMGPLLEIVHRPEEAGGDNQCIFAPSIHSESPQLQISRLSALPWVFAAYPRWKYDIWKSRALVMLSIALCALYPVAPLAAMQSAAVWWIARTYLQRQTSSGQLN